MVERRETEISRSALSWPALTLGAFVAGILAVGAGRAASSLFARDSDAALLAQIIVAIAFAGGAGITLGTGDVLRARWRTLRRR